MRSVLRKFNPESIGLEHIQYIKLQHKKGSSTDPLRVKTPCIYLSHFRHDPVTHSRNSLSRPNDFGTSFPLSHANNSQTVLVLLVLAIFPLGTLAGLGNDLHRRQSDPCLATSCSFLSVTCPENDDACICAAFNNAGSATVSACASCEQSVNATFAAEILSVAQSCASAPGPSPTPTNAVDPCFASSCNWLQGIDSCADGDVVCVCNVINSAGSAAVSACITCEKSVNATFAQEISAVAQSCPSPSQTDAPEETSITTPIASSSLLGGNTQTLSATTSIHTVTPVTVTPTLSSKSSGSDRVSEQVKGTYFCLGITMFVIIIGLVNGG
jgi:hypothetical protein